ncbi:type II toxin-antitoxin system Phd/YefM family antitoxin [Vibrio owensii]|uniref:Antitoxin n=1 Tax=Vibrio owensii CAIM 1854 = LMG 25443 TaxID=1229493 RepID=A0A0C1VB05_9VIBR|nr:type II toxin-antitoxin system Phd/YefM family antitoxin [Vibrio owensii]KIF46848.1 antitoxin [Vibrio owensii CAIM 1854 = LMG 25443]
MGTFNTRKILTDLSVGVSELKRNPMAVMSESEGQAIAVLNRNKPVFYAVPADLFEDMMDLIEDQELIKIIHGRKDEPRIKVNLDDL